MQIKRSTIAYYSARNGIYRERKHVKSTLTLLAVCLLAIGMSGFVVSQSVRRDRVAAKAQPISGLVVASATIPATPAPTITTVKPVAASPQSAEMNSLSAVVQVATAQNKASSWGVGVYDLQTKTWLLRDNVQQQMNSASLYKLYVAYALSQKVPFAEWATTQMGGQSLQTCVDLMLRVSDNDCGNAVGAFVGWRAIDTTIHAAGFVGTTLNRTSGPVTNVDDTTRFTAALYQGKLFDKPATDFILASLHNQQYRSAIPAGCDGCKTYNKTGIEGGSAHDTAVVVSGNRSYVVTIMSEGGSYTKIASIERAIQTVISPPKP